MLTLMVAHLHDSSAGGLHLPDGLRGATCTQYANRRWGTLQRPDALGPRHQWLGLPIRGKGLASPDECCERCAETLGCTAWTWTMRRGAKKALSKATTGTCTLRRWQPLRSWVDSAAVAGTVHTPCTENCLLPRFEDIFPWPKAGDTKRLVTRASMSEIPWMKLYDEPLVHQFQLPPDGPILRSIEENTTVASGDGGAMGLLRTTQRDVPAAAPAAPSIAVCMAGQARTLSSPLVYRNAFERLLERGRHDLFAVLSTGSEGCPSGCADMRTATSGRSYQARERSHSDSSTFGRRT